jgi:hypothetical protein
VAELLPHGLNRVYMQITIPDDGDYHISTCLGYTESLFDKLITCAGLRDGRGVKVGSIGTALGLDVEDRYFYINFARTRWIRIRSIITEEAGISRRGKSDTSVGLSALEEAAQPHSENAIAYADAYREEIRLRGVQRDRRLVPSLYTSINARL